MNDAIDRIEKIVLSSIFFDAQKFDEICDLITYEDFSSGLHAAIFKAFSVLNKDHKQFSPELVYMTISKEIDNISIDEIDEVSAQSPIVDINSYVNQIKNASINRSLFSLASFIRDESTKEGTDASHTLEQVSEKVYGLSVSNLSRDFRTGEQVALSTMKSIEEVRRLGGKLRGVNTGFRRLNDLTTGFNPGELVIIGARPGMGKTALILSMTLKIISGGKGVAICSLEMPAEQIMLRMLSAKGQVPLQSLRSGDLTDGEWGILSQTLNDICEVKNLYIDDESSLTLTSLRAKLRKLFAKDKSIGIVMVDYLQLMGDSSSSNKTDRYAIVSEISRGLKLLARELNVPVIALSQLNRTVETREDKRPIMSDLRDSGSIEQDADIVLFIYRDELYKERESRNERKIAMKRKNQGENVNVPEVYSAPLEEEAELIIAKNRSGAAGESIKIIYKKQFTLFEDLDESTWGNMAINNRINVDIGGIEGNPTP